MGMHGEFFGRIAGYVFFCYCFRKWGYGGLFLGELIAEREFHNWRQKIVSRWEKYGAWVVAAFFYVVIMILISRQHTTFNHRAADLDRFLQGMWNTYNGRFMYSTMGDRSILSGHFTPMFVLISPLQFIWNDPRVYSLYQTAGFIAGGLILHKLVAKKHPRLAIWFMVAFFLNPVVNRVALLELRRITLAVPFLILALYGLAEKQRRLMLIGLVFALFCKENVALLVVMFGVYLILIERDWRWGLTLVTLGFAWLYLVIMVINPILDPRAAIIENDAEVYRGFTYFSNWGESLDEILLNMLRQPHLVIQLLFDDTSLRGLFLLLLPVGFILPLLTPAVIAIPLPLLALMLLSSNENMRGLVAWYPTAYLPFIFAPLAFGCAIGGKRPRALRQQYSSSSP
jgi:uncharacterized membrane protein